MNFSTRQDIEAAGFLGFLMVNNLQTAMDRQAIPNLPGVYFILRTAKSDPVFLDTCAAFGKMMQQSGFSPTKLQRKWEHVKESVVVYIGPPGGPNKQTTLFSRLDQYLNLQSNHKGGRAIWQFSDSAELIVCWKTIENDDPEEYERQLLDEFKALYGDFPLANWRRGNSKKAQILAW